MGELGLKERTPSYAAAVGVSDGSAITVQDPKEANIEECEVHHPSRTLSRHDVLGKTIARNEAVTLRVKRKVNPGREAEYEEFIQDLAEDAKQLAGFMGITVLRPNANSTETYWNVFIKFDSHAHSELWYRSASRLRRLQELDANGVTSDNPDDVQVDLQRGWVTRYVADSNLQLVSKDEFQPVTVVITRRIQPGAEDAYRDWCMRVTNEAQRYPGHLGTSLILPSPNDDRWIVLYRFDSFAHIEAWHASPERVRLVEELLAKNILVEDEQVDMQTGWSSYFTPGEKQVNGAPGGPPPKYRTAVVVFIAVWIGVTLLSLENNDGSRKSLNPTLAEKLDTKRHPGRIPLEIFLSNLVAIPIIFFLLVPTVARVLRPWLRLPGPKPPKNKYLRWPFRVVV